MKKKTILIDLDGVLNQYNGKFNEFEIPEIRNGAKEFIKNLSQNFIVKIFTTRDHTKTLQWLIQHDIEKYISEITDKKEPAYLLIDDRCICFGGNYTTTINQIENFKPWYK